ncbi:ArnT family glycosyltransferase [Amycolatopsis silviterrae]|uniref:ArnT family glycosyltransferase n=1 Tax=Amycolatopsis silviterrae TaxID=1656914 RepID=A0ABW5HKQ1_9PSEU
MTVAAPSAAPAETAAPAARARWQPWALAAICAAAGALYAWRIGGGQLGNSYYSAAVKSMTGSFSNFLFGSFDPYGVFTVDKPPMSLWPQAVSVLIFGFHGWSLLLPQVLEGVAAVFLLHRTVRLWAGENAALLAALFLALTPITVAINRDNNPDTLLVLLLIAAAYAFTRSVQSDTSRTRWLLWCAFFVGCGFVTKMMQAWIVLPGFALAYFVGTSAPVKRRLLDLLGAAVVLLGSSFWWTALHDLWPGSKPYMGGSTDGTALNLIFGYNGFGRIFGGEGNFGPGHRPGGALPGGLDLPAGTAPPSGGPGGFELPPGGGGMFGGETGLGRMFSSQVGGQISWLLPLALLVLVAVAVRGIRRKHPGDLARRAGWFAWGSWLLVTGVVFSYAQGIWHPYYTTMLAPAIAAICAAGLVGFWREYRHGSAWLLLPAGVALTAGWAFVLANRDPSWHGWTRWAVLAVGVVAVVALVAGKLVRQAVFTRASLVLTIVTLLLVPTVWSTATAATGESMGGMPSAGPSEFGGMRFPGGTHKPGRGMADLMNGKLSAEQQRILAYAKQHSGGTAITLAVAGPAMTASSFVIGSDETVIGMGGFLGSDDSPSVGQLQQWTAEGKLKFVLGTTGTRGMGGGAEEKRQEWIKQHCTVVDPAAYGGKTAAAEPGPMGGAQTLYQCHA